MSEDLLELAAGILGPVVEDVAFVGGATIHLWLTEETAPSVRATDDVDVICDVASYGEYQKLAERLRDRRLEEAYAEPVICRWRHRESGLAIDVMPTSEEVLGFSNRWYDLALKTAVERVLPSGRALRAVAPPVLIATKLAAWRGRGNEDVLRSLDVHDVVVLVDGRPELVDELSTQDRHLRSYVGDELAGLLENERFEYVIQSAVAGYGDVARDRAMIVKARFDAIVGRLRDA
jgi:predicted nucleotidyltransferase